MQPAQNTKPPSGAGESRVRHDLILALQNTGQPSMGYLVRPALASHKYSEAGCRVQTALGIAITSLSRHVCVKCAAQLGQYTVRMA